MIAKKNEIDDIIAIDEEEGDDSLGQIAFINKKGLGNKCITASADRQNGTTWLMYIEGERVGAFDEDLKVRTGD